jgi:hypothetical protein
MASQTAASQSSSGPQYAAIEAGQPVSSMPDIYKHAAIEAPQMAPNVPGTALVPVNRFVAAATGPGNALVPVASSTQYDLPQVKPQYTAAQPAPTYEWGISPSDQYGAAGFQGQLESAPAQIQQIAGFTPQLQLEAPTSSSTGYPTTGQELVHQSRDLERQHPRR